MASEQITRDILKGWVTAKDNLDKFKFRELQLRNLIADDVLGDEIKGTHHGMYGLSKASVTAKLNFTVTPEELKIAWKDLTPVERECIQFKPTVKTGSYNKLPEDSLLKRIVIAKPGTPTLKVKLSEA